MNRSIPPPPADHRSTPLLGLRRKPGRLALAVFRMPLRAYRHDAGWLLGHTFLLLVHTGRKTGQPHSMVAMVFLVAAGQDPRAKDSVGRSRGGGRYDLRTVRMDRPAGNRVV